MAPRPAQRVDHALLIGVDLYQYIWPPLSGCVGDVEALAKLLVTQLQTPPDRVIKLTAGHTGKEKPEELATRDNIVAALRRLAAEAGPGEQVYVHYSGHGMRNDGTVLPGYEADGRDEAIAPTDTGYQDPAAYYLLDKELGWLIRQITDKGAFVTVVLDCCHSASGTRNLEQEVPVRHGRRRPEDQAAGRGWEGGDPRPRPDATLVAPLAELRAVIAPPEGGTGSLLAAPANYVLLSACRERETAKEYQQHGVFSHFFLKLLEKDFSALTYGGVQEQVGGAIRQLASARPAYADQTPQLEGDRDLVLFGGGAREEPRAFTATPQAGGALLLSGGTAVGLTPGTTVALYPPGAVGLIDRAGQLGLAMVIAAEPHQATARAAAGVPADRLQPGMRAVVVRPGLAKVRRRFAVGHDPGLDELRAAVAKAGRDGGPSPYLELVGLDDLPELSVTTDQGRFVIRDEHDRPLPRITPPTPVGAHPDERGRAAREVVRRLEHVVQYRNSWELHNEDEASSLKGMLGISVVREGAAGRGAGHVGLSPGEVIRIRIHNRSAWPLNAALLYFAPDWSVRRLWPGDRDSAELAKTGDDGFDVIRQKAALPTGVTSSTERLKLFATDQPASFDALTLGSLDAVRAVNRSPIRNPLEELLARIGDGRGTRELIDCVSTGDWSTAELVLETTV
jgi:hypothetical protein